MQEVEAGLVILGLFLVRLGVPIVVIAAISYWLRRVDARWAAEASAYQRAKAWPAPPVAPAILQKPALDPPCWERRGCSPLQQAQCAAGQQPCLPCWLARLRQEGQLPVGCTTCAIFALPVRSPVATAGD